ncbi:MAG: iron ABC transporter permease [Betaproteobacteria bacterium RIFCSPHIGHO2_12_FULL_69_13]|nr:MAG: iron ABC transporter permease [Betaproteobacteria bacterium RIFCSPHIGHO2_12_FULL_69_13]OGA67343.1 MAG: iron ABC transporter permease [Betaproteobacteria bacterium RIFCSPLOWO2_12_FULL_68_20]
MLDFQRLGLLGAASLAVAALILLPILAVLSSVFAPASGTWSHLVQTALGAYVWNTALLLAGTAAGVMSMGVLAAWLVTAYRFPGQRLLEWALVLPLAMPAYVTAYAYTDWLQFTGPVQSWLRAATGWQARDYWFPEVRSLWGAAAMLSFALYPYVYLVARTAFLDLSRSALEAGRLAGHSAWGSFVRVALPLARPAIAAGTALALMETLADFGTVSYFALEVFTTGIFKAWFSMGDSDAAGQLSAWLLGFVVLVLALERASRGRAAYASATRKPALPQRLAGAPAALAFAACAAPVVFGFLLPAGILLQLVLASPEARWGVRVLALVGNSFILAGITAALGVVLATAMAYAARLSRSRPVAIANRCASLGYAIPGAVIAVGILVPLARFDNWLAAWVEASFGMRIGLLLTGTIVALVYAYLVRFLAAAMNTMEAGLAKITPSMEDAARSLGAGPASTLARVHLPLLGSSLATAGLLVFLDVMKELPATFALRPFNFDTLAIEAYQLAQDERLAEAAVPSLVIVAVSVLPLLVVWRRYFQATRS